MILTYHEIAAKPSSYVYSATTAQLAEHLKILQRLPDGIPNPGITFDDGHSSHHRYAMPLLEEAGMKAIFFITCGWSGTRPEYMSWKQLSELANAGHQVHSHGWSHALLTHCGLEQLTEELRRSRRELEDRLGRVVDAISMPGGRFNRRVLEACEREGYRRVFVSDPYLAPYIHGGLMVAGRAMVRRTQRESELIGLLRSEHSPRSFVRMIFRLKRMARLALGDRAYHQLWRRLGASEARKQINRGYSAQSQ
jgi:peptidoglycan/xylan/chitin deacetylase (PgdA/CDA1 family)